MTRETDIRIAADSSGRVVMFSVKERFDDGQIHARSIKTKPA